MHRRVLLLIVWLWGLSFAPEPPTTFAAPAAGGGILLDLSDCLTATPCTSRVAVFPQLRLLLGTGWVVAHLDLIHLPPGWGALWIPSGVFQMPVPLSAEITLTPYAGIGALLGTANAPLGAVDWVFKLGNQLSLEGFAIYGELSFAVPLTPLPNLALGALVEF